VEEVLKFLTARMQIEAEWAVQEKTSFTWWAHTLAQRVRVAEPREVQGVVLTTLHIETDLLADVPMNETTWARLAGVNQFATLSAYVADTSRGTVGLHASVSLTAENWLLARAIALHAMALQMADAYAEAAELAEAFGGRVDAMDRLLKLADSNTRIVPGLGPVMTRAQLQVERDVMKTIYDRTVDRVREGDYVEDMLKAGVMNGLARTWKDPKKFLHDLHKGLWAHHNKLDANVV